MAPAQGKPSSDGGCSEHDSRPRTGPPGTCDTLLASGSSTAAKSVLNRLLHRTDIMQELDFAFSTVPFVPGQQKPRVISPKILS